MDPSLLWHGPNQLRINWGVVLQEFSSATSATLSRLSELSKFFLHFLHLTFYIEYLGSHLERNAWSNSRCKSSAILNTIIKTLRDLRRLLGACNFNRRNLKNFTYSSAIITERLNKSIAWNCGPQEDKALHELKLKLESAVKLGTPQTFGKIVLITDARDISSGACLFQWQTLDPQVHQNCHTQGVNPDGSFKHNYPNECTLTHLVNDN